MLSAFDKPEYFYRPMQIVRRIDYSLRTAKRAVHEVDLPWGLRIRVRPNEDVGRSICTLGLYDLVVTEGLVRLLDPGEFAMDIGANIGYTTAALAARVGPRGRVMSFEPMKEMYQALSWNLSQWTKGRGVAKVEAVQAAVSSVDGEATLYLPQELDGNAGLASLEQGTTGRDGGVETVKTIKLDTLLAGGQTVDLIKIDVEGHELSVIEGAHELLGRKGVRDIVFEDHGPYPSPIQQALRAHGYHIYCMGRSFWRPILHDTSDRRGLPPTLPPNFLATRDPQRALVRFAESGWNVLSNFHV